MAAFIIGCEVAFWILVLAGLACRYLWGKKRLGAVLLIGTPMIDLALLVATFVDLRGGAEATLMHGLAAVYIGVSIAFGHSMIRWADIRFAYWAKRGPQPPRAPRHGAEHARRERQSWFRHLIAWAIGCALLYGLVLLVGDEDQTAALLQTMSLWSLILGVDFLISFSYTLWPRQPKKDRA